VLGNLLLELGDASGLFLFLKKKTIYFLKGRIYDEGVSLPFACHAPP